MGLLVSFGAVGASGLLVACGTANDTGDLSPSGGGGGLAGTAVAGGGSGGQVGLGGSSAGAVASGGSAGNAASAGTAGTGGTGNARWQCRHRRHRRYRRYSRHWRYCRHRRYCRHCRYRQHCWRRLEALAEPEGAGEAAGAGGMADGGTAGEGAGGSGDVCLGPSATVTSNLVVNGDAEQAVGSATGAAPVDTPPWVVTGHATASQIWRRKLPEGHGSGRPHPRRQPVRWWQQRCPLDSVAEEDQLGELRGRHRL